MDESTSARPLIQLISADELAALESLIAGESLQVLAHRLSIDLIEAGALQASMKRKLGAVQNADAVRLGLTAGLG